MKILNNGKMLIIGILAVTIVAVGGVAVWIVATQETVLRPAGGPVDPDTMAEWRASAAGGESVLDSRNLLEDSEAMSDGLEPAGKSARGVREPSVERMTEDLPAAGPPELAARGMGDSSIQVETHLKAGEIDDNERWDDYLDFVQRYRGPEVHATSLANRQILRVTDRNGMPASGITVEIMLGPEVIDSIRTYADGRSMFFLPPDSQEAVRFNLTDGEPVLEQNPPDEIRTDGTKPDQDGTGEANPEIQVWSIILDRENPPIERVQLDVLFLLDSTGSMADEIHQIKTSLISISEKVSDLPTMPGLRFGMVSYRDRGDDYVVRSFQFDADVERFARTVEGVEADGGNDYPESLNEAIRQAIRNSGWRDEAVRLIFLIADAPPHLDYPQDSDYAVEMAEARRQGIKVFSVASSGLDQQGEYILRQIAQQTMGRFIFILYEDQQGHLDTPHDVGEFTVNRLDSLIVRLIREEMQSMTGVRAAEEEMLPEDIPPIEHGK